MFGPLGLPELIFIFIIALLIFGPKRLPEIGKTVGKAFAEFRRASEELKRTVNSEISALDEEQMKVKAAVAPVLARPAQHTLPRGPYGQPKATPEIYSDEPVAAEGAPPPATPIEEPVATDPEPARA